MHRRTLFGGLVGTAVGAALPRIGGASAVEAVSEASVVMTGWVALGNRWAFVEDQSGQPTISWTGRYDESGVFHYDEFGTFLPGFTAPDKAES